MTKDLADELERLAKEATPGEWQGIETMPANTRVLVWVDGKHMHGVQFGSAYRNSDGTLVAKPAGCNGGPWAITHWRPLPPPPKG